MDYTCDNCVYRHTWDCDDYGGVRYKCEDFTLDESTISEDEKELLRVMRYVLKEKGCQ